MGGGGVGRERESVMEGEERKRGSGGRKEK